MNAIHDALPKTSLTVPTNNGKISIVATTAKYAASANQHRPAITAKCLAEWPADQ